MLKLKMDGDKAVLQDGKPVFVDEAGKDVLFDVNAANVKIATLSNENRQRRENEEKLTADLKKFEGIEDPEAARKALNTVKNLDDKKLIDAGKAEEVKNAAIEAVKKQFEPVTAENTALKAQLDRVIVGGAFARSKFIAEKMLVPPDVVEAMFSKAFKRDGEKLVGQLGGKDIYSRGERPGEIADFDEAISIILDAYPHKDKLLKGGTGSGGGSQGGKGGAGSTGDKTMSRAEFERLPPATRSERMREGFTLTD